MKTGHRTEGRARRPGAPQWLSSVPARAWRITHNNRQWIAPVASGSLPALASALMGG